MAVLAWRNDADGFAFINSWTLDPVETAGLTALAQPAVWSAVGAIAAVLPFPDPLLLTAAGVAANLAIGAVSPTVGIGLCGGMAYASLDYWHARAPLPRGAHENDRPTRAMPAGGVLRWCAPLRRTCQCAAGPRGHSPSRTGRSSCPAVWRARRASGLPRKARPCLSLRRREGRDRRSLSGCSGFAVAQVL